MVTVNRTLEETTFWTNSSPTSSFTGRTITLPDITPYKLIKVTFRVATGISTEYYELYTPDQLLNATYMGSDKGQLAILASHEGNGMRYVRYFRAPSATSIQLASADNNSYIIPIKISGLK